MEGFGLSMAEAMSMGLPILACNSWNGLIDLVQNNYNGILVKDDPTDIAEGLKILMDNVDLRYRLGAQGHESMKRFSNQQIWDDWERLLYNIVHN